MTEEFIQNYLIPIVTFVFSVGVIWGGFSAKLASMETTHKLVTGGLKDDIAGLKEELIHRIEGSCNLCKERDLFHKDTHKTLFKKLDQKADK